MVHCILMSTFENNMHWFPKISFMFAFTLSNFKARSYTFGSRSYRLRFISTSNVNSVSSISIPIRTSFSSLTNEGTARTRNFSSTLLCQEKSQDMTSSKSKIHQNDKCSIFDYKDELISKALVHSSQQFEASKIPEPLLSSCHLLSYALNLPWSNGFYTLLEFYEQHESKGSMNPPKSLFQRHMTASEAKIFQSMCQRRILNEPLQYILGQWDFYDNIIKCRAPILCPRPETEELVDIMIHEIKQQLSNHKRIIRILDVGCGTGAIGLTIANYFSKNYPNCPVQVVGIDLLQEAIDLSMENAQFILGSNTHSSDGQPIYQAILTSASDFTNIHQSSDQKKSYEFYFDMIVSNPPYIPSNDMKTLSPDVIEYESIYALCGGNDGMDIIRDIVKRLPEWTQTNTNNNNQSHEAICWMEVDTSHPKRMEAWLNDTNQTVQFVEGRKDLSGRDRFVKLKVDAK